MISKFEFSQYSHRTEIVVCIIDLVKVKEYLKENNIDYKITIFKSEVIFKTKKRMKHVEIHSLKKRIIIHAPKPIKRGKSVNTGLICGFTGCLITGNQFKYFYE